MGKKLIEMVCTGNNGRSPVAELIGRNYIEKIGAAELYNVISSGTLVDTIKKGTFGIPVMVPIINVAKGKDLYSSDEIKEIDEALGRNDAGNVKKYFMKAANKFKQEEADHRTEILNKYGINGNVKENPDQTIARPDTKAVLSVDKKNCELIKQIYGVSKYNPIIDVISRLATGNPDAEIKNAFGLGIKEYEKRIEQLVNDVPKAIDKVI